MHFGTSCRNANSAAHPTWRHSDTPHKTGSIGTPACYADMSQDSRSKIPATRKSVAQQSSAHLPNPPRPLFVENSCPYPAAWALHAGNGTAVAPSQSAVEASSPPKGLAVAALIFTPPLALCNRLQPLRRLTAWIAVR